MQKKLLLNNSDGRADFVRHLYNLLCVELALDLDQDTRNAIQELNSKVDECDIRSMYTNIVSSSGDGGHAGTGVPGGEYDRAQLRAHGYEIKPKEVVYSNGGDWETLFKFSPTFFYFAMLTLDPRRRIIFLPCIDPKSRTRI
jgi:hypothetical protein